MADPGGGPGTADGATTTPDDASPPGDAAPTPGAPGKPTPGTGGDAATPAGDSVIAAPGRRAAGGGLALLTTRLHRMRKALTVQEWRRVAGMAGVILGLHAAGFFILLALVVPRHFKGGFGLGVGVTAYTLGMRHAFDADHIAAIDNTTRKLMGDGGKGERALAVGFFFSLGHATVVFGLAVLLAVGVRTLAGAVEDDDSELHAVTGLVGTAVSGTFLCLIAGANLVTLAGLVRVFRRARTGRLDEQQLEEEMLHGGTAAPGGVLARWCCGPAMRAVTRSWHMYPLGVLFGFGFGFDTATEIALLVLAADAGVAGLPWYAILCLPLLFAAGMSMLDTLDGAFMNFAYGWALSQPVRKLFYNIVVTALSVTVAFLIGAVELLSILGDKLSLRGAFWRWLANIDLNVVGYVIVGLFVLTWFVALAIWHGCRIEQRWSDRLLRSEAGQPLNPAAAADAENPSSSLPPSTQVMMVS